MVHIFFISLLFFRVNFKEEEIMNIGDHFSMQLSHYGPTKWKQKKQSNIYVFIHSPFFPNGKFKILNDQESVKNTSKVDSNQFLQLEKYRSFILTFPQTDKSEEIEKMRSSISIDSDDDLPLKIAYWRIPKSFCQTSSNFFISTDYQIKSSAKLKENACLFFDPKGISNLFQMKIYSAEQITIEFYINNSLYTNPDYECSSVQPNQTLSCVVPYSQPFFARIVFNKKKFINNLNCVDSDKCNDNKSKANKSSQLKANFSLDYSSLYNSQKVHDCFIEQIPIIQLPDYSSARSNFLSENLKQIEQFDNKNENNFKIENKICLKFSVYKTAVISRIAVFFSFLFVITFILQIIGYIDLCDWSRKPAEVAFVGLRDKFTAADNMNQRKSRSRKFASLEDIHNDNEDVATSPLIFSIGPDFRRQQQKTVSCANFYAKTQTGQSRNLRKLSESGGRANARSGIGQRSVFFQPPNFIATSPSSASSSSLQEYRFENVEIGDA